MLAHFSFSGFFHQVGPSTPYKESRALHVSPLSVLFATNAPSLCAGKQRKSTCLHRLGHLLVWDSEGPLGRISIPSETQSTCIPKQYASRPENNCTNIYAVTCMPALHIYKIYDESIMINLLKTPTCMVHHLCIFACFCHASCVKHHKERKESGHGWNRDRKGTVLSINMPLYIWCGRVTSGAEKSCILQMHATQNLEAWV